jgi:hypothetical protein
MLADLSGRGDSGDDAPLGAWLIVIDFILFRSVA